MTVEHAWPGDRSVNDRLVEVRGMTFRAVPDRQGWFRSVMGAVVVRLPAIRRGSPYFA